MPEDIRNRILATTMLGSPGGFSGGNGSRFGAGGSSLSMMACHRRTRGDSGKRSAAIVWRSREAMAALSSGVRSAPPISCVSAIFDLLPEAVTQERKFGPIAAGGKRLKNWGE